MTMQKPSLLTDEVMTAKVAFIAAVERAIKTSGMDRDYATARLSAMLSDLWNLLESRARRLPRARRAGAN